MHAKLSIIQLSTVLMHNIDKESSHNILPKFEIADCTEDVTLNNIEPTSSHGQLCSKARLWTL